MEIENSPAQNGSFSHLRLPLRSSTLLSDIRCTCLPLSAQPPAVQPGGGPLFLAPLSPCDFHRRCQGVCQSLLFSPFLCNGQRCPRSAQKKEEKRLNILLFSTYWLPLSRPLCPDRAAQSPAVWGSQRLIGSGKLASGGDAPSSRMPDQISREIHGDG
jgi:hypothetical protein